MTPSSPTVDDSSSLRAALSVIDDWDIDFGSFFASPEPSPVPRAPSSRRPAPAAKAKAKPYTGPNRRKREIQALRDESEDLEEELARVRERIADAAAQTIPTPESELSKQLTASWRELAERQRTQRETLEEEHESLQEAYAELGALARQMFETSRRFRVPRGLVPGLSLHVVDFDWPALSTTDPLTQLDALYGDMPSVFGKPSFTSGRREFQEIQTIEDANGHVLAFDIAVVLPFDIDHVADALWRQTTRLSARGSVYQFKDLATEPTALVSQFAAVATLGSVENHMQGEIATRQYAVGETREIVSKVVANVLINSDTPFTMSGEGWLHSTPLRRGDNAMSPLTQVHWHRRIRIHWANENTFILKPNAMLSRVQETVAWNLQCVENHLLAQARRKHKIHGFDKISI